MNVDILRTRPTVMDVHLDALEHNLRLLRKHTGGARIMAVVKANAYGHGLVPCARFLEKKGVDYFGVAFVEEGVELRRSGINSPILVFGGILSSQIETFLNNKLDLTASSVSKLRAIDEVAKSLGIKARVQLKVDTGMERIGIHSFNAWKLFDAAYEAESVEVTGVFSHLARAEDMDLSFTFLQFSRFQQALRYFEHNNLQFPLRHIANSAACLRCPEMALDMVRPGVALYGVTPDPLLKGLLALKPVMELCSKVVFFKVVTQGSGVSYGHRWVAPCDTRVATVALGYGDGFFRRMSNLGSVLIRGKRKPIIGSVCMDQLMVDLGPTGEAYVGDDVILIGKQEYGGAEESITVEEIAKLVDTVPHEVLVSTNLRVPRRYFLDGKELAPDADLY